MAGMDWFRWHHGSVNDPKFQLVARKAGASVAEVVAVWACLLEAASQAAQRGNPGNPDLEAMDCALGLQEGLAAAIYGRMTDRGLIAEDGFIVSWEKRQPKREREDDLSTGRVRSHRERQETPCNANDGEETPREEKSREEKKVKPRLARKTKLPDDFAPNETGLKKARDAGLNVERELERFRDHHTAQGTVFLDWQAAWRTWIGKAVEFGRGKAANADPYGLEKAL